MPFFGKVIDEKATSIMVNVKDIMEQSKMMTVCVIAASSLTVGYILGAVTTGAMCRMLYDQNQ